MLLAVPRVAQRGAMHDGLGLVHVEDFPQRRDVANVHFGVRGRDDLVRFLQAGDESRPEEAVGAGDEDFHVKTPLTVSHQRVDYGVSGDVDDAAHAALEVGEVDGLVEAHLYRAEDFDFATAHVFHQLVGGVGAAQVREDERVDVLAEKAGEGIFPVAEFTVEGEVELHLTVDGAVSVLFLQDAHGLVDERGAAGGVCAEVRIRDHGHDGRLVEEFHRFLGEFGDVDEGGGVGMSVDERVGDEERALVGIQDVHRTEVLVSRAYADDFLGDLDGVAVFRVRAGDEGVGVAGFDHHHAEIVAFEHFVVGFLEGEAFSCALVGEDVGVAFAPFGLAVVAEVDDFDAFEAQLEFRGEFGDAFVVTEEDGVADAFVLGFHGGLEHRGVYAFGEDDALGVASRGLVELADELALLSDEGLEVCGVLVPVLDVLACDAAVHGSFGDGHRNVGDEARVDGLRDEVVASEDEVVDLVDGVHHVGHGLFRQIGDGVYGGELHLLVDGCGGGVECAAEDVGEADDVVDLVGVVAASGGHEHVGTRGHGGLVGDFGLGVGEGEDDGVLSHGLHHVLREDFAFRQSDEDVGVLHGLGERVDVASARGELFLLRAEVFAVVGDDALGVEHDDVFVLGAEGDVEFRATDGRGAGAVDDDAHVGDVLAGDLQRVDETGGGDDGGAVLVVVHHGDVELFLEPSFDFEAFGRLDVLEVDAAKGRRDGFHGLDELVGVGFVDLDVEDVDAAVDFEQEALAFHHGLAAEGADVAQTEHRRAVADDGDEVALAGVFVGVLRVFLDFKTRLGHTGGVGETEVGLCTVGLCRNDFYLAGLALRMVGEGGFFCDFDHGKWGLCCNLLQSYEKVSAMVGWFCN